MSFLSSLLLFHFSTSTCARLTLSPHIAHSAPSSSPSIQYLFFLSSFPYSLILPVVSRLFDYFPSFLFVCVFVPCTQLYIHPSSFCPQSLHFFTAIPSNIHFVLKLCRSLSHFHSQPIPLALFPHYGCVLLQMSWSRTSRTV
jgi:hypothetical protein